MQHGSNPTNADSDDAAIYEIAHRLHLVLGDLVDDVTFVALVDAVAGVTQ
jgi:hypothetical protein